VTAVTVNDFRFRHAAQGRSFTNLHRPAGNYTVPNHPTPGCRRDLFEALEEKTKGRPSHHRTQILGHSLGFPACNSQNERVSEGVTLPLPRPWVARFSPSHTLPRAEERGDASQEIFKEAG
jgi:hypothetical protein